MMMTMIKSERNDHSKEASSKKSSHRFGCIGSESFFLHFEIFPFAFDKNVKRKITQHYSILRRTHQKY